MAEHWYYDELMEKINRLGYGSIKEFLRNEYNNDTRWPYLKDLAAAVGVTPATLLNWRKKYGIKSHRERGGKVRPLARPDIKNFEVLEYLKKGHTLVQAARRFGCSRQLIGKIKNGKRQGNA